MDWGKAGCTLCAGGSWALSTAFGAGLSRAAATMAGALGESSGAGAGRGTAAAGRGTGTHPASF